MPTTVEERNEMKQHLVDCFKNAEMASTLRDNFNYMLNVMGVSKDSGDFVDKLIATLTDESRDVDVTEAEAWDLISQTEFETQAHGKVTVEKAVEKTLQERAEKIGEGTANYLKDKLGEGNLGEIGRYLDYGGGSGRVTGYIAKALQQSGWKGEPTVADINDYRTPDVREEGLVKFCLIGDHKVVEVDAAAVELATITHVLHHAENSDAAIKDLARILKDGGHVYMLEVIPQGDTPEEYKKDRDRMSAVDIFYSRVLHSPKDADIPVRVAHDQDNGFESVETWTKKLEAEGFRVRTEEVDIKNPMFPDFKQTRFWLEKVEAEADVDSDKSPQSVA